MRTLIVVLFIATLLPAFTFAQSVAQVTTLEVPADKTADYVEALKTLIPILRKHSPRSNTRIWQATVAGSASNRITVIVEFPSMLAWAERGPKMNADPAYKKALEVFEGMERRILSVSLHTEL